MRNSWNYVLLIAIIFPLQSIGMNDRCPRVIRNASLHACPPIRSSFLLLGLIAIGATIGYYSTPDPLPQINHHGFITNQTHQIVPELNTIFNEPAHNQTQLYALKRKLKPKNKS